MKKFRQWNDASKILHGMVILGFTLAILMSIFSCEDTYIGKSKEEIEEDLIKAIIEVDSLLSNVKFTADTLGIYND